jgi:N-acetylglutamate synthase-like GNAT family acetyltransferase
LTRYPEEINITIDKEIEILRNNQNSNTDMMIVAFVNNELAGNVVIRCERNHIKLKHRAVLGISVKGKYWNKGIGNELLREVIEQARVI